MEIERLYKDFPSLYAAARAAGLKAGNEVACRPMVVSGYENDPVMDGVCGFAWIRFPGNTAFGKWAKANGAGRAYPKGLMFWVGDFNQSMTRKAAYAQAFADVLRAAGIEAYADSRMD